MWRERLEVLTPRTGEWLRHQSRDAYWRSGSVAVDYGKIKIPVLAVGGWADGYSNAILRLMTNLEGPRKAVIGPWAHAYPHVATPGPRIDFLGLVVRWMDRWLKGVENGIDQEPMLTAWMQESEAAAPESMRNARAHSSPRITGRAHRSSKRAGHSATAGWDLASV